MASEQKPSDVPSRFAAAVAERSRPAEVWAGALLAGSAPFVGVGLQQQLHGRAPVADLPWGLFGEDGTAAGRLPIVARRGRGGMTGADRAPGGLARCLVPTAPPHAQELAEVVAAVPPADLFPLEGR